MTWPSTSASGAADATRGASGSARAASNRTKMFKLLRPDPNCRNAHHGSIRNRLTSARSRPTVASGRRPMRPPDQTAVERDELADLYDRRLQQASCDLVLRGKTDIPRSQGRWTD